jgi:hypothetical protein
MKKLATYRNFGILIGILLIAYALFGYFSNEILIFTGRGRGGPQYAHGEQVILAALGFVSFAIAAFIFSASGMDDPSDLPDGHATNNYAVFGIVFVLIGLVLVGFRTPG